MNAALRNENEQLRNLVYEASVEFIADDSPYPSYQSWQKRAKPFVTKAPKSRGG